VIEHNTFNGPGSASLTANAAIVVGEGNPEIVNNTIGGPGKGFQIGIRANNGANPTITGNTIQDLFQVSDNGLGVELDGATATIVGNRIANIGAGESTGIYVHGSGSGATLSRNSVIGLSSYGVYFGSTSAPVSVDGDLIVGSAFGGLVFDTNAMLGTATNVTVWDNGKDLVLINGNVTLDSSVLEDPVDTSGTSSCAIGFSRGPTDPRRGWLLQLPDDCRSGLRRRLRAGRAQQLPPAGLLPNDRRGQPGRPRGGLARLRR
jgi:Right handed beta helix region